MAIFSAEDEHYDGLGIWDRSYYQSKSCLAYNRRRYDLARRDAAPQWRYHWYISRHCLCWRGLLSECMFRVGGFSAAEQCSRAAFPHHQWRIDMATIHTARQSGTRDRFYRCACGLADDGCAEKWQI